MTESKDNACEGKVLWHFTMSLDGFVAGPEHSMAWMTGFSFPDGEPSAVTNLRLRPAAE